MNEQPKERQETQDRSAFEIGDERGEGGQRDLQDEHRDEDELPEKDEFVGMAATGEQNFAKDGQGAPER